MLCIEWKEAQTVDRPPKNKYYLEKGKPEKGNTGNWKEIKFQLKVFNTILLQYSNAFSGREQHL